MSVTFPKTLLTGTIKKVGNQKHILDFNVIHRFLFYNPGHETINFKQIVNSCNN